MTEKMADSNFFMQYPGICCGLSLVTVGIFVLWKSNKRCRKEIIVFSRYPVPGKTKTRLIPALGDVGACMLQRSMTEHIVKTLEETQKLMNNKLNVTLQFNGGTVKDMQYWLGRKFHNTHCVYRPQAEGSLGIKLSSAIRDSFSRGNTQVIVIGADIPGISPSIIQDAFTALSTDTSSDIVIGPAEDFGYYLIGFTATAKKYLDDVFADIDWGTDKVFVQQVDRAKVMGLKPSILKQVLNDVDIEDDLGVFEKEVGINRQELRPQNWSIIIPVLNEETVIGKTLEAILQKCSNTKNLTEIIVSDGGSKDRTTEIVDEFSKTSPVSVQVIHSKPGRGYQQIAGADAAKGDNFLFLHADTMLPKDFDLTASNCLLTPGIVAGAFEFYLNVLSDEKLRSSEPWWFILEMKFCVWITNRRSKGLEFPYGDQTLFMSKRTYREVGGFPPYYLMEDFCMVEKLRTIGHVSVTNGHKAVTDYRRWRKWGYIRITALNQTIITGYKCGVHPNTLAKWYYGDKLKIE